MNENQIELSLVLACYNEAAYLRDSISHICGVLDSTDITYEIIFVDDKSSDNTRNVITELVEHSPKKLRKVFNKRNLGRGGAVSRGILRAKGEFVGYIDLDLEVGAHYIPYCIQELRTNADVVTAWRIYRLEFHNVIRWIASRGYSALVKLFLKLPYHDTETGFKFFRRQQILRVLQDVKENGWFWDTEIMARCHLKKLSVVEKPCLFIRRHDKESSVHLLRDSSKYFMKLLKYLY